MENRKGIKMKKTISILLLSFFFFAFDNQVARAQVGDLSIDYMQLLGDSKDSPSGLEVFDYKKVFLKVGLQAEGNDRLGLTEEGIRTKCESRLGQAGLELVQGRAVWLTVVVQVVSDAFSVSLSFSRGVLFDGPPNRAYFAAAITWERGSLGMHGNKQEFVMKTLDGQLDEFLKEYLEANEREGK
jgi:hypothetical protein